jgi:2,4-dienoyl-CoA reductase-like NADH-dependent reductase (Old Yellow Enzyme family)
MTTVSNNDKHAPPSLATPLKLARGQVIKNRFFKAPMSEQLADRSHNPTPQLDQVYRTWAQGGSGLVVTGAIIVDRRFVAEPKNVVLDQQTDREALRRWASAGKENDTRLWAQLMHPGKQIPTLVHPEPIGPSAIPLDLDGFNTPRAVSHEEILELIEMFANAAELAKQGGFDGVQIHAAHGFLCTQFLSPLHNQRSDQWGGSLENRMRFTREIYKTIRQRVGECFPIGVKLNSADFQRGGLSEEESMQVVAQLEQDGVDLLEISGGTLESRIMFDGEWGKDKHKVKVKASTQSREAYFMDYAHEVRRVTNIPVVLSGGFRTAVGMQAALDGDATDMVGIARPMVMYPDLPNKIMHNPEYEALVQKHISTGVQWLDDLALMDVTWYQNQLQRIGSNKSPRFSQSAWLSFAKTMTDVLRYAWFNRRY